jgi:hypothetical protein
MLKERIRAGRDILADRLRELEARLPHRGADLTWGDDRLTRVHLGPELLIGRSPHADLPVPNAALSREHARIFVAPDPDGRACLWIADRSSRVGTFWDGRPVDPEAPTPVSAAGTLGLGVSSSLEVFPLTSAQGTRGALLRPVAHGPWRLFLPHGGPLVLDPDHPLPAGIESDEPYVVLVPEPPARVVLNGLPLGPGAKVDLLVGDRVELLVDQASVGRFGVAG